MTHRPTVGQQSPGPYVHSDKIKSKLPETIRDEADIIDFVTHLIEVEDLNFHPDTPFEDYISYADGHPTYTDEECAQRNRLVDECFALSGDRFYDIGLAIFMPTFAIEPSDSQNEPEP